MQRSGVRIGLLWGSGGICVLSAGIFLQRPLPRKAKKFYSVISRQKCVKFYGSSLSPNLYNRTAIWLGFQLSCIENQDIE